MSQGQRSFALGGGLDLTTPAMRAEPGRLIGCVNYEAHPRGYARVAGFERFDGQTKPSDASYSVLEFDAGSAGFVEGETVTAASGGTGICLVAGVVESGSYGGGDAAGYLVITEVSGTIADDDALTGSGSGAATANGAPVSRGASNDADDTTWLRDAIETARTAIGAVPGSGPIRGVWYFGGAAYAFRDNAGATACVMHKATAAGWVAQTFGRRLAFTSGGAAVTVEEGDTIEGGTSGATATVERVVLQSGSWAGGDAAGYFILSGQTGTFQAENIDDVTEGGSNDATIAGDSTAITLAAGGTYRFVNYNFFGASNLRRMYFVNGLDQAHEWDGSILVPIATGMTTDTPTHIEAHKSHLFLAFAGGSLQHSAAGDPYAWSVVLGAAELGIGEEITGLLADVSGVLAIFGRNRVGVLKGTSVSDWDLDTLADDAGAVEDTAQLIGAPIYLDDKGLRNLSTTDRFGDFSAGTISERIERLFETQRNAGVTAVASCRVRAKTQYRLFWSDGTGLSMYLGRQPAEPSVFDLGKVVGTICSSEDGSGNEIILFAADDASDAYVYEMESGTSFDGEAVSAYIRLPFNHMGSPQVVKGFHRIALEVDTSPNTVLELNAEFSYADPNQPPADSQSFSLSGGGGFYDEDNWDEFFYDAAVEGLAEARIKGRGTNIAVAVRSDLTYETPHVIHGMTINYTRRRMRR